MLTETIYFPDKQKKRCIGEILASAEGLKTRGARQTAAVKIIIRFYDELVKLPFPFQIAEAKKWLELLKDEDGEVKPGEEVFKKNKEKKAFKYISEIAGMAPDFDREINEARQRNERLRLEISEQLKSLGKEDYDKLADKAGGLNMLRLESYLHN